MSSLPEEAVDAGITPTQLQRENKLLEIFVETRIFNPQWHARLLKYFGTE